MISSKAKRTKLVNSGRVCRILGKGLKIPEGGWTGEDFAAQGRLLMVAIARAGRIAQKKRLRAFSKLLKEIMDKQIREIVRIALQGGGQRSVNGSGSKDRAPDLVAIALPQSGAIWAQAIENVFAASNISLVVEVAPTIQSTMAQGMSQTSQLLGETVPQAAAAQAIAVSARGVAAQIVNTSGTTKLLIERVIKQSISEGLTVSETAIAITEKLPAMNQWRSLTIARTELNRAWGQGVTRMLKASSQVTHVSVIGCEEREDNSPTYQGASTCNISNVPVNDADSLDFHINHTGNIVPSNFRNRDGTVTDPGGVH